MDPQIGELAAWCEHQRAEAQRQIELFGSGGVKALLQMPDGSTQDITAGVLTHQTENVARFERLASALGQSSDERRFERRNLSGAAFHDCALPGARFDDVDLSGAQFSNVNLRGARFTDVNMREVAIEEANIEGLTIYGIDIHALVDAELGRRGA